MAWYCSPPRRGVLDAAAHEQLGDLRAAEESIERALELAEPDGMILPFVLAPVGDLLERHPRHRTAHAILLTTILDLLAASRPPGQPPPPADELSDAELRVLRYLPSNLKAPKSPPTSAFRRTPSGPICATSTPSSAPTTAARRSPAAASSGCSDPVQRDGGDHSNRVTTAHPGSAQA